MMKAKKGNGGLLAHKLHGEDIGIRVFQFYVPSM